MHLVVAAFLNFSEFLIPQAQLYGNRIKSANLVHCFAFVSKKNSSW